MILILTLLFWIILFILLVPFNNYRTEKKLNKKLKKNSISYTQILANI